MVTETSVSGCCWLMSENDIQASQMLKGERGGQALLPFRWTLNSIDVREVCEEPGKDLQCQSERHSSDPVNACRAENLAINISKAWIYQHGTQPRLLWPLLMYQVPLIIVEGFERTISQFLCR